MNKYIFEVPDREDDDGAGDVINMRLYIRV